MSFWLRHWWPREPEDRNNNHSKTSDVAEGMRLYQQKGNCQSCHGWAGDGRKTDSQMPDGANLRETKLNRAGLVMTIKCGRLNSQMPAFDKFAYSDGRCYGKKQADLKAYPTRMPDPPATLQQREIELLADFMTGENCRERPDGSRQVHRILGLRNRRLQRRSRNEFRLVERFDLDDRCAVVAADPQRAGVLRIVDINAANVGRARQHVFRVLAALDYPDAPHGRSAWNRSTHRRCGRATASYGALHGVGTFHSGHALGLGIEHADRVALIFAKPQPAFAIDAAAPRAGIRSRSLVDRRLPWSWHRS